MDWFELSQLPEHPSIWKRVFVPAQTVWETADISDVTLRHKAEALHVLFITNPHFLKGGLYVLREYVDWCDVHYGGDFRLSSIDKAKRYLDHRVSTAQERWYDDAASGISKNNTPEECAMNAFRSAICHLDALARWQGCPLELLSTEEIKVMKDRLARAQNVARATPRDYAASSRFLTKRLTQEEMEAITECWWDGTAAERIACTRGGRDRVQMRGLLFHCLQRAIGRRGADLRNLRNAMLFIHRLPNTRPVQACPVIGASLRHVKEYAENVEHLLGWARAYDRFACPLGALACYFVWLNDCGIAPIIEEIKRDLNLGGKHRAWWKRMLFVTDVHHQDMNETPMAYTTHNKAIHAGFEASGAMGKTAATHIYRSTLACDHLEAGASFLDVGLFQGWHHDNAADAYLRGAFKSNIMLRSCGWEEGTEGFRCWWEGTEEDIPIELRSMVLPGLDEVFALATNQYEATKEDRSAIEFLKVLRLLRRIFLEDAIFKRDRYPDFPPYRMHDVFQVAQWPEYCEAEAERTRYREKQATTNPEHTALSHILKATVETAVRDAMNNLGNATGGRPGRSRPTIVDAPTNATIEIPRALNELPEIPDPSCLYTCYQIWQQQRSYFYATPQPPWKKRFGDRAATMKLRYSRMRPYLMYLDRCGASARRVIDALDAFRVERKVTASVFIKQCFYHLEHALSSDCQKPPPIMPDELRSILERDGLPPFVNSAASAETPAS